MAVFFATMSSAYAVMTHTVLCKPVAATYILERELLTLLFVSELLILSLNLPDVGEWWIQDWLTKWLQECRLVMTWAAIIIFFYPRTPTGMQVHDMHA